MRRHCSQILYCSPNEICRTTMIELDDTNHVLKLQNINELQSETAQTKFHNGIISPALVSLQKQMNVKDLDPEKYIYINLCEDFILPNFNSNKKIIFDAGTENPVIFSMALQANFNKIKNLTGYEIIAASCWNPAEAAGINNQITLNSQVKPILWQNCDLASNALTENTEVVNL